MRLIQMKNPVVEMDGDEMTRILWRQIKDTLLLPFVALRTEYYDLGLRNRDATDDRVTLESAEAIRRNRVGVKCATITANRQRLEEYGLKALWKSPNATLRAALDGTVFRAPILVDNIRPAVRSWQKPITIARHAYGDVYKAVEYLARGPGKAELLFTDQAGEHREEVFSLQGPGILQAMHNTTASIESFARACFRYAINARQDLWFATKDTISKVYDGAFKEIFQTVYDTEFKSEFESTGIAYFYTLIDDAVARVMRSQGGFIWACKNYDGDVMSDMVSAAFGSLAMMTSVLVSPEGCFEYEAAHGTVTRHYYRHLRGEETSTNPVATIFAWSGALRKRGELDGQSKLIAFSDALEAASRETIQSGVMTKDLSGISEGVTVTAVSTQAFLNAIQERLSAKLEALA